MTPEGRVKKDIRDWFAAQGIAAAGSRAEGRTYGWFYCPLQNGMGVSGIADFIGCWRGQFFAVEAKRPGGKPTANQVKRINGIRAAGGIAGVVDSAEDLDALFSTHAVTAKEATMC